MRLILIILAYLLAGAALPVLSTLMITHGRLGGHNDAGAGILAMLVAGGSLLVVTVCFIIHMTALAMQFQNGASNARGDLPVGMPSAAYVLWALVLPMAWSLVAIFLPRQDNLNQAIWTNTQLFAIFMLLPLAAFLIHLIVHLGFAWTRPSAPPSNDKA